MSQVGLLSSAINRDPERFDEPEAFKPERFLNEKGQFVFTDKVKRQEKDVVKYEKSLQVLFFGVGKRRCVGEILARAELYITFGNVAQNFRFRPVEGFKPAGVDLPNPGIVFYPEKFEAIVETR